MSLVDFEGLIKPGEIKWTKESHDMRFEANSLGIDGYLTYLYLVSLCPFWMTWVHMEVDDNMWMYSSIHPS